MYYIGLISNISAPRTSSRWKFPLYILCNRMMGGGRDELRCTKNANELSRDETRNSVSFVVLFFLGYYIYIYKLHIREMG